MIEKYNDFVNEALASEMKVGDWVLFGKNLKKYKTKGTYGKIVEIRPNVDNPESILYRTEIDAIDATNGKPLGKIVVNLTKIENLRVIRGEDYDLLSQGKIAVVEVSDRLKYILDRIKFNIPEFKMADCTFIDVEKDKDDSVSFLPVGKIKAVSESERYSSKMRQVMKVGRFFRKIKPDIDNVALENLSNEYRAIWTKIQKENNVEIVTGEDIRYWYYNIHYQSGSGTLNSSCMQYERSQRRFNIYCENPDKIAMCIMTNDKGKLVARALLWRLDEPEGQIYIDRIYTVDRKYENIVMDFAKSKGWLGYNFGNVRGKQMVVYLKKDYGAANRNPYMDTFRTYGKKNGKYALSNSGLTQNLAIYSDHD